MSFFLRRVISGEDHSLVALAVRPVLWVLSCLYALIVVILRWFYGTGFFGSVAERYPVISVGNITVGGVGKTPLVIFLAKTLYARGKHPVILTRGYMAAENGRSDEAEMMAECLPEVPVMVNSDRVLAIKQAKEQYMPDVFILDDGFQHWRLQRDLDIVAIDATNPFGNGHVLPRGLLREPLHALKRADLFILTKTDLGAANVPAIKAVLMKYNFDCPIVETIHAPVGVKDVLTGKRQSGFDLLKDTVVGVCALGLPGSFEALLLREGAVIERMFHFKDHHLYTKNDVWKIAAYCRTKKLNKVVTTHKDAVKIRNFPEAFQGISLLVLEIEIKVTDGKDELLSRLDSLCYC